MEHGLGHFQKLATEKIIKNILDKAIKKSNLLLHKLKTHFNFLILGMF